ncbi:hypothetical protein D4Q85_00870 [bacterium]|nr:MAG: hypothetical protein D4Q85_00870 [bacterium]
MWPVGWWLWNSTAEVATTTQAWYLDGSQNETTNAAQFVSTAFIGVLIASILWPSSSRRQRALLVVLFSMIGLYPSLVTLNHVSHSFVYQLQGEWAHHFASLVTWSRYLTPATGLALVALLAAFFVKDCNVRLHSSFFRVSAWLCMPTALFMILTTVHSATTVEGSLRGATPLAPVTGWWSDPITHRLYLGMTSAFGIAAWTSFWLGLFGMCFRSIPPTVIYRDRMS